MSTHAIREAFSAGGVRCTAARMRYTEDRKAQILEFDVVHGGKQYTVVSDPVPHNQSLHAAAAKIAAQLTLAEKIMLEDQKMLSHPDMADKPPEA